MKRNRNIKQWTTVLFFLNFDFKEINFFVTTGFNYCIQRTLCIIEAKKFLKLVTHKYDFQEEKPRDFRWYVSCFCQMGISVWKLVISKKLSEKNSPQEKLNFTFEKLLFLIDFLGNDSLKHGKQDTFWNFCQNVFVMKKTINYDA